MRWGLFGLLVLFPYSLHAAVYISEVAWMGSVDSANHEWIELHNDGEEIDVTNWKITDGANLEINLAGTIPANSYVVLERTSDDSAEGSAFLIYTGALVNTGTTLKLQRGDGSLSDQVSGGEGWEIIGGDNVTKETAQYTSSGWVTAVATPGSEATATKSDVATAVTKTRSSSGTKLVKSSPGETVKLELPNVTLQLDISAQEVGYVNQPINFAIEASGIGDTLLDSLKYEWNFGDGYTSLQKETTHIFTYPGTYVVTVYAGFKRQEQAARREITILPVAISLTTNKSGDIQINNDSPYEIDISSYRLRGKSVFEFPKRSILLPNQTVTIAKERVGGTRNLAVGLYDTEGLMLASVLPDNLTLSHSLAYESEVAPTPQVSSISTFGGQPLLPVSNFGFLSDDPFSDADSATVTDSEVLGFELEDSAQLASAPASGRSPDNRWTYLALAGVLFLGTLGMYAKPKGNENL